MAKPVVYALLVALLAAMAAGECQRRTQDGKYDADVSGVVPAVKPALGAGKVLEDDCDKKPKEEVPASTDAVDTEEPSDVLNKLRNTKAEAIAVLQENKGLHIKKHARPCSEVDPDVREIAMEKGECSPDANSTGGPTGNTSLTADGKPKEKTKAEKKQEQLVAAKEKLAKAEEEGSDEALAEARFELDSANKENEAAAAETPCANNDTLCKTLQGIVRNNETSKAKTAEAIAEEAAKNATDDSDDVDEPVAPKSKKVTDAGKSVLKQLSKLVKSTGVDNIVDLVGSRMDLVSNGTASKADRDAMKVAMTKLASVANSDAEQKMAEEQAAQAKVNASAAELARQKAVNASMLANKTREANANLSKAIEDGDEDAIAAAQKRLNKTLNGTDPDTEDPAKYNASFPADQLKIRGTNDTQSVRAAITDGKKPCAAVAQIKQEKMVTDLVGKNKSLSNSTAFRALVKKLTDVHISKHEHTVQAVVATLKDSGLPVDDIALIRKIINQAAGDQDHSPEFIASTVEEIITANQKPKSADSLMPEDMVLKEDNTQTAEANQKRVQDLVNEAMLLHDEKDQGEEESVSEGVLTKYMVRFISTANCSVYKDSLQEARDALSKSVDTEPENVKIVGLNDQVASKYESVGPKEGAKSCKVIAEIIMLNGDRAEDNLRYLLSENSDVMAPLMLDPVTVLIKSIQPADDLTATQAAVEMFTGISKEDMTVHKVYEPKKKAKASTVLANTDVAKPLAKVLGLMKLETKNVSLADAHSHNSTDGILAALANTTTGNVTKAFDKLSAVHKQKSAEEEAADAAATGAVANATAQAEKDRIGNLLKRAADAFGNALGGPRMGLKMTGNNHNVTVETLAPANKGKDSESANDWKLVKEASANQSNTSSANSTDSDDDDEEAAKDDDDDTSKDDTMGGGVTGALSALKAGSVKKAKQEAKQAKKIKKAASKGKAPLSPEAVENLPMVKFMDAKLDKLIITDTSALSEVQAKLDTPAVSAMPAKVALFTKLMEARKVKIEADYLAKTIVRRYAAGQNISMETLFRLPQFRTSRDSADDNIATLMGVVNGEVKICDAMQKLVRTGEYGMTVSSRSKAIVKAALDLFEGLYKAYLDSLKVETPEPEPQPDDSDAQLAMDAIKRIKQCKNSTGCTYADMYKLLRTLGQNYTGKAYTMLNHTRVEHGGCKGDKKKPAKQLKKKAAAAKLAKAKAEGAEVDPEDEADANATETAYAPNATLYASILGGATSLPDKLRMAVEALMGNGSNSSNSSSEAIQLVKEAPAFSPAIAHLIGKVSNTNPDVVMAASQVSVAERSGNKALIEQAKKRQDATEDVDDLEKIYAKKDKHDDVDIHTMDKLDKAYQAFSASSPMTHATIGIDLDFSWAADNKDVFETAFKVDVARAVNCSAENITLLGVRPGSTVVDLAFLDLGTKDLSLYLRRVKFTALKEATGFPVSLVFFKEEAASANEPAKKPFVNASSSGTFSMPVDIADADKVESDPDMVAVMNASGISGDKTIAANAAGNDTNATWRLVRTELTEQFNTRQKSLQVRLLEGVRKVLAKNDSADTDAKMGIVDRKIAEVVAKEKADEESPDEETQAEVKSAASKAVAMQKQLATAEAKLDEAKTDGSSDEFVGTMKEMLAQAKAASSKAEQAKANATASAAAGKVPKNLKLSLANMTRMLARNGTFLEDPNKRDNAATIEAAKARLIEELFGDEENMTTTMARMAASSNPQAKDVLAEVQAVNREVEGLAAPAASPCVGKECALKEENASLQSKIEQVTAEQREFISSKQNFSGADGISALVLANMTAGELKVEECKQSCMGSKCFPSWDMSDAGAMKDAQQCITLSSQCKTQCVAHHAGEGVDGHSIAVCESNCQKNACPSDTLKVKRDDWKAQGACRATCVSQCQA